MIEVINKYSDLPMVWGESDCCQFVGECIESISGENPAHYFRYASEDAARKLIATYGGLDGIFNAMFGSPVDHIENGFVGVVPNNNELAAGVFINNRFVCRVENSLVDISPERATKVWNPCRN